ncbi:cysteine synthase A [bacterium]|nr:cysteine synthase A [bacterium]
MTIIYQDNSYTIGNTPVVRLSRISEKSRAEILVKIEARNPSCSVKCRIGASMIWDAEKKGILKHGMAIVEPTSGNTGIALASVSAARGYPLTLTMPDTMSMERQKLLRAFGANVVLTDGIQGMQGAVKKAEEIFESDRGRYILLQQFKNPANPAIHEKTTGPEIWRDTRGQVDIFVAGVGTGGTFSGTARFLKSKKPVTAVAVEPAGSPVIRQTLEGKVLRPGPHKIQGIGAGFVPENLDLSLVDRVEAVTDDDAMEMARRLAREEGIISGISSGAAVFTALRLSQIDAFAGKTIVVILPDSGERYLSTQLYEGFV